jgi:NADH-quinone oxidoreductase subunit L
LALDAAAMAPLCVLLPLASGALLAWVRLGRAGVAWVSNLAVLAAFAAAVSLLGVQANLVYGTWTAVGSLRVPLGILVDPLSVTFALIITGVGFLIHLYSVGYMAEDRDFARYFSGLNFFVASMLLLVLADSFPLLLVGWAGVGLASYLLIGFWYDRPLAVVAARKAFLINIVGDVAILVAILIMAAGYGRVDYAGVLGAGPLPGGLGVAIALLLLTGACAKSAQLPLHTWLPDAMEGPTPVSALIHAATMVTAGAYLLVRAHALFVPAAQVAAVVGGASCLVAATLAVCQYDFKRLLAFSTMSQVGYMFLGAAVGAAGAAVSHVVTHAFFKALLFLCAGAVMHALGGDEKDLRNMGGLARRMPLTNWTFLASALAIAGFPGLSGFWSKDAVLEALLATGHPWLWVVGVLATPTATPAR